MNRFLKSRLVRTLTVLIMLASAIAIPMSRSIVHSHAASSSSQTSWNIVPSPSPGTSNYNILSSVSTYDANNAWAVGTYQNTGESSHDLIEHWDGTSWAEQTGANPGPNGNALYGVIAFSEKNIWAVGSYSDANNNQLVLIEHSTDGGLTWTQDTNSYSGTGVLFAIDGDLSSGDAWTVGIDDASGISNAGYGHALTLQLVNGHFSQQSNISDNSSTTLYSVSEHNSSDVWAVGHQIGYINPPYGVSTFTMHYNGSSWTEYPSPNPYSGDSSLQGVTTIGTNNAWAVGTAGTSGMMVHWDGSSWNTNSVNKHLSAITTDSSNTIWAAGTMTDSDWPNNPLPLVYFSSDRGTTWEQDTPISVYTGSPVGSFDAISFDRNSGNGWAVGYTPQGYGQSSTLIEQYDIQPAWWGNTSGPNMPCDYTNYKNATTVTPVLLTSWRGIQVCGPAPTTDLGVKFIPNPNGTLENEFECTELVKRYLLLLYGLPSIAADGYQIVNAYTSAYPDLLKKITPGKHIFPSVGDVLSYGIAAHGHTSIVTAVANPDPSTGSADVTVIEQNIRDVVNGTETMHMSGWQMSGKGGTVASWMTFRRNWSFVPSPSTPTDYNYLNGVAAASAKNIWAVGLNTNYSPTVTYKGLIEHWNGSTWSSVTNPAKSASNTLNAVAAIPGTSKFWAVGYSYATSTQPDTALIEQCGGTICTVKPSFTMATANHLYGVAAISATNIWVVGTYTDSQGNDQMLIEQWNGSQWMQATVPPPSNSSQTALTAITAISAINIWAVGSYTNSSGIVLPLIEHWDGTGWIVVPAANPSSNNSYFQGVAAIPGTQQVWVVGYYEGLSSPNYDQTLTELCTVTSCSIVPTPDPGSAGNSLSGIVATSASTAWAVGTSGQNAALIEEWNGTTWNAISVVNIHDSTGASLFAIASVSATNFWAVGNDTTNSSTYPQTLTEEYH